MSRGFVFRTLWTACWIFLWVSILGCQPGSSKVDAPNTVGYLLSGLAEKGSFTGNTVVIFNWTDFSVIRKVSLPASKIDVAELAPDGNLWVGLSGGMNSDDDRVEVLSASGDKVAEIYVCLNPTSGIWFYSGKAYIVCRGDGFSATIAVIDTVTFSVEGTIYISMGNQEPFLVIGSGLSGQYLAVTATVTGLDERSTYAALAIVDLETNSVMEKIQLGAGTDVWGILSYQENLYLLNIQGIHNPQKTDMIIVSPGQNKIINSISLQTHSPLWGVVSGNNLFSYQNGEWNTSLVSPERSLCGTKLTDYSQSCVQLPEGFWATDVEMVNSLPCVAHWGSDTSEAGLYCLDNGKFELKLASPDASLIVVKK